MKINDLGIYPPNSTPALPAKTGQSITQQPFGTPIVRVTDDTDSPAGFTVPYSGIWDCWNVDSTRFTFTGPQGRYLADFDPTNLAVSNRRVAPPAPNHQTVRVIHPSRKDPGYYYSMGGPVIYKVNWATGAHEVVVDLTTMDPTFTFGPGDVDSRGMSDDERRFHVNGLVNGKPAIAVVDVVAKKYVFVLFTTNQKCSFSADGSYVKPADSLIFDIDARVAVMETHNGNGDPGYGDIHCEWAYLPNGQIIWASNAMEPSAVTWLFENPPLYVGYRSFPDQVPHVCAPFGWNNGNQSVHTSLRERRINADGTGPWALHIGTPNNPAPTGRFVGEIFSVPCIGGKPDGSVNRRICHTYATGHDYYGQVQGCQSQDGRFVLMSTDGASGIAGNPHLYIVHVTDEIGKPYGPAISKNPPANPLFDLAITNPSGQQVKPGSSVVLQANKPVVWSISPSLGAISPDGTYTPPANVDKRTFVNVEANDGQQITSVAIDVESGSAAAPPPPDPPPPTPAPPIANGPTFTEAQTTVLLDLANLPSEQVQALIRLSRAGAALLKILE